MLTHKAYKFRIYPTKEQEILIVKTIGCSRFVFNHFLAKWDETYKATGKGLSYGSCSKELPSLKQAFDWLKEVDSTSVQTSVKHLADAFDRFFKKQNERPRFKSKRNPVQSYKTNIQGKSQLPEVSIVGNKIKIPKLKWVRFANSRQVVGRILNATIRRNASGKYFVSLLVEQESNEMPKTGSSVGVDVGLKHFAILSDGTVYKNDRYFRSLEKKLAREQRKLSRRQRLALDKKVNTFRGEELSEAEAEGRPHPREDREQANRFPAQGIDRDRQKPRRHRHRDLAGEEHAEESQVKQVHLGGQLVGVLPHARIQGGMVRKDRRESRQDLRL